MSHNTAAYQRLRRANYKRNPKHVEVQAVLNLWASAAKQAESNASGQKTRQQKPFDPGTG